jgi:hypothetical protein
MSFLVSFKSFNFVSVSFNFSLAEFSFSVDAYNYLFTSTASLALSLFFAITYQIAATAAMAAATARTGHNADQTAAPKALKPADSP